MPERPPARPRPRASDLGESTAGGRGVTCPASAQAGAGPTPEATGEVVLPEDGSAEVLYRGQTQRGKEG